MARQRSTHQLRAELLRKSPFVATLLQTTVEQFAQGDVKFLEQWSSHRTSFVHRPCVGDLQQYLGRALVSGQHSEV